MDNAVALVQPYLRVNGGFTVADYPVVEAMRRGYREATDLDILAFQFPGADSLCPELAMLPGGIRWRTSSIRRLQSITAAPTC